MKPKIIAIIPARGGSKGIKRKNLRLLGSNPLIYYSIKNAMESKYITDIVVTSEDENIIRYVSRFPVITRNRPLRLSQDSTPLDPVILDAVMYTEKKEKKHYDIVVTLQPTSPLLTADTLDNAIKQFTRSRFDTMISACDNTHLDWKLENGEWKKNYGERINRQWLPQTSRETGAFVICKRQILKKGTRIGNTIEIYEVPEIESIDVDKPLDWYLCRTIMNRMSIYFVVSGNSELGMGHINRTLTLADYWFGNDINFLLLNTSSVGKTAIEARGYKTNKIKKTSDVTDIVKPGSLIVNDILDTSELFIKSINEDNFVVNFEDLGDGADLAHLVFNALYEKVTPPPNHMFGYKYEFLSENFLMTEPNRFNKKVNTILIAFGGADPSNLTIRVLKMLENLDEKIKIKVAAYKQSSDLERYVSKLSNTGPVEYLPNIKDMAELMRGIDLAITSNGRTVYELAAMGIPIISIAQNDRETLHLFARYSKGVKYLGIASNIDDSLIQTEIIEIIKNQISRKIMYENLPINELRDGISNVTSIIEFNYGNWLKKLDVFQQKMYTNKI